jgi:hypothetical protein
VKKPGTPKVAIKAALVSLKSDGIPGHWRRNHFPEFLEAADPLFARVAGNDRGIDGADRDAGNPFGLEIVVTQRLIGAGLIGTERAAALQNKHALRLRRRRCWRWIGGIHRDRRSNIKKQLHRGVSSRWRQSARLGTGITRSLSRVR